MQLSALTLAVRSRALVNDISLTMRPGECWCLIGRNGAGKSTLLRTMAGLREPERGEIRLLGRPLRQWPLLELARQRAFLAQGRNDPFSYRAIDTVLAARHPYQDTRYWDDDADVALAMSALRELDVAHLAGQDVRTLSGGERQRVAMAAVLAQDTPLLLLDEPTGALDLAHQVAVTRLIGRLCHEQGKTVALVSHDLNLSHAVATHAVLLMGDGGWRAGAVEDIMQAGLLGECLGYPIDIVRHHGRTVFIPSGEPR
ncbi:ABC transporter ATP-binding protein [Noviherbaspirillum sp. 17J57-3]|uniref:ABC transporter ATP-binding protein n=2 Tax=Noviherbaspirillum galbum TaxID=2709383 RepID=A0A6B3SML1_9BURK|nr:ABC transporter ATP-binding protein [Noviherbaspirillum galbum]